MISANTIGDEQTIGSEKDMQQIGAFRLKKNAERLAKKLQNQQVKAYIAEGKTKDNQKIYRVFIAKGENTVGEPFVAERTRAGDDGEENGHGRCPGKFA